MRLAATHILAASAFAAPVNALSLAECTRTTHISHGGEAAHRDLGEGRVAWESWWSQEGVYLDLHVADCGTGEHLTTRAREERMSERAPFDRTEAVRAALETELAAAPSLFSFERLANALKTKGRDTEIAALAEEPCACAAAYPELRGTKTPYEATE